MENNKQSLDEEKRQIIFRMNMYILQALYLCLLDEITSKYENNITGMGNEVFYKILNTNRTDYSKYKNGIKTKVTKNMTQLYSSCPKFKDVFEGKELIKVGELTYGEVKDIIEQSSTEILNVCKQYCRRLSKNIVNFLKEDAKQKFDDAESQIASWLHIQIAEYWDKNKSDEDQFIRKYTKLIKEINFEQLDGCSLVTLTEFRKEIGRTYKMTERIYNYKEEKKNHTT